METKQKVTTHGAGWDARRQRSLSDWFPPEQGSYAYLLAHERKTTLAGQTGPLVIERTTYPLTKKWRYFHPGAILFER